MANGKKAYTGELAKNYDADRVGESIWQKEQELVQSFVSKMPEGSIVLDAPFGTGRFTPFYAEKKLNVYAVDISQDMLDQAQLKYGELTNQFTFMCRDASHLPLEDNSVNYVICSRLAHLVPHKLLDKILGEFSRVVTNQIYLQIYSPLKGNKPSVLPLLKKRIKDYIYFIRNRSAEKWTHIKNYDHYYNDLIKLFEKHNLKLIEEVEILDEKYVSSYFILSK